MDRRQGEMKQHKKPAVLKVICKKTACKKILRVYRSDAVHRDEFIKKTELLLGAIGDKLCCKRGCRAH